MVPELTVQYKTTGSQPLSQDIEGLFALIMTADRRNRFLRVIYNAFPEPWPLSDSLNVIW